MGLHPHAAQQRTLLGRWHTWCTPTYQSGHSWSAMPVGAMGAVITGAPDREALEKRIREYASDIDGHVREARRKLDALPAHYTGERNVQERLIAALAALYRPQEDAAE